MDDTYDMPRFKKLLSTVRLAYPSSSADATNIAAYWQFLKGVAWEDFELACNEAIKSSKYFPSASELLALCDESRKKRIGRQKLETDEAGRRKLDRQQHEEQMQMVPSDREEARKWIAEAEKHSPEWYARRMLCESKHHGIHGESKTPADIAKRRMGEIQELVSHVQTKMAGRSKIVGE